MKKSHIVVFGANPAWQKVMRFEKIMVDSVNRAHSIEFYAAGKGVNFARAINCMGTASATVYQFADGVYGELHVKGLQRENIKEVTVHTGEPTRCCMTCIDENSGQVTELIEPSYPAPSSALKEMCLAWNAGVTHADGAAITGSLPDGTDASIYIDVAMAAAQSSIPLLVDAASGIGPALDAAEDFILKINRGEFLKLTGEATLKSAFAVAEHRWPRGILAITNGGASAYASVFGRRFKYSVPVMKVVSPIGCGDTCSAVMLCKILEGMPPQKAFAWALAAACANCLNRKSGSFKKNECEKFLPEFCEIKDIGE